MNYLWQNYDIENEFYIDIKPYSPYLEIGHFKDKKIGVNPLLRFHEVFAPLFESSTYMASDSHKAIENCLLHYLAQIDLNSGVHKVSLLEDNLNIEIKQGHFGQKARDIYLKLNEYEKHIILIYLQRHEAAQGIKSFFFDAVETFFPKTKSYYNEFEEKFLLCIPTSENDHNNKLMELLILLLLDMEVKLEVFWDSHFGIIGEQETMRLDDFIIY